MLIILLIHRNKFNIVVDAYFDHAVKITKDLLEEIRLIVSTSNLDKKKFKRYVLAHIEDQQNYVRSKLGKIGRISSILKIPMSDLSMISGPCSLKVCDGYVTNKRDIKFIKEIFNKHEHYHGDDVICYDSDQDHSTEDEEETLTNGFEHTFSNEIIITKLRNKTISISGIKMKRL